MIGTILIYHQIDAYSLGVMYSLKVCQGLNVEAVEGVIFGFDLSSESFPKFNSN